MDSIAVPAEAAGGRSPLRRSAPAASSAVSMPSPRRIRLRVRRAWFVGLFLFGYGPAFTYGWLTWLLNEQQWFWTYLMYATLVPLLGGVFVVLLPCHWYRPIDRTLQAWARGQEVPRDQCVATYERALALPFRVALGAFIAVTAGYLIGTSIVHWRSNQPFVEMIPKTLPAIPLVSGLMGAFCYFGTARALQPVLAACSARVRHIRPVRQVPLGVKFLSTACILAMATVCLIQPAAYTLGQRITEQHVKNLALLRLQVMTRRLALFERPEDRLELLQQAALGARDYVFAVDGQGRIVTPHPRGYRRLPEERLYRPEEMLRGPGGVWVDRVGRHRVVAFVRANEPPWTFISISFPEDFSMPLRQYIRMSWVVILEVLVVVMIFGRYYTRSITTPLGELTRAAQRIAEHGDLSQQVPVTTDDELGELARSFNRMLEELHASKADLEDYTKRLERSTQELSALNQEMEDLLRVASHDLRAPLINIQGFSKRLEPVMDNALRFIDQLAARHQDELLQSQVRSLKDTVQLQFGESLRFISKGVEKMDALLCSLLAVSRVGRKADPIQPNDLDGILDDVLAIFDHQLKERAITVIRHPLPAGVPCRRNEVNQVFSNLVSNAINYMGPTGRRFIEIGGSIEDDHATCYVRDSGIGIGVEDQVRVFQMFTRLQAVDAPGEGVGLAYVRKILRSHGGRIWVASQKRQGSTFFFTLPTRQPAAKGVVT